MTHAEAEMFICTTQEGYDINEVYKKYRDYSLQEALEAEFGPAAKYIAVDPLLQEEG